MDIKTIINNKEKISNYIKDNFNQIYDFNFNGELYLVGSSIRHLTADIIPKDLDIILLNYDNTSNIEEFLNQNNLNYTKNSFGGYKINYNGLIVDMWSSNDLLKCIKYNLDALFFNIQTEQIISFGYVKGIEDNNLEILNNVTHPVKEREIERTNGLKNILN